MARETGCVTSIRAYPDPGQLGPPRATARAEAGGGVQDWRHGVGYAHVSRQGPAAILTPIEVAGPA